MTPGVSDCSIVRTYTPPYFRADALGININMEKEYPYNKDFTFCKCMPVYLTEIDFLKEQLIENYTEINNKIKILYDPKNENNIHIKNTIPKQISALSKERKRIYVKYKELKFKESQNGSQFPT